jgi:hypothetical protein
MSFDEVATINKGVVIQQSGIPGAQLPLAYS